PRYRILAKLGHSSFSTVWLARDLDHRILTPSSRNVALKIIEAKQTSKSTELAILQRLSAEDEQHRVIQMLDVFEQISPNGVHQVLVMELVHPLDLKRYSIFRPRITRMVVRQLVEGLASIHSLGIAHGDLHPGNLGIAAPEANDLSELQIWEGSGRPYTRPLVHSSMDQDPASFPPYLCDKIDLGGLLLGCAPEFARRSLSIRILDMGNAYFIGESSAPRCHAPLPYAPPEVVFPRIAFNDLDAPWDQHSDIWSLA
ncbi:kinase-like domain-containing protein, partial [Mycena galopus ATCC 62051]